MNTTNTAPRNPIYKPFHVCEVCSKGWVKVIGADGEYENDICRECHGSYDADAHIKIRLILVACTGETLGRCYTRTRAQYRTRDGSPIDALDLRALMTLGLQRGQTASLLTPVDEPDVAILVYETDSSD
jgi:hypothetical protein